LSAADAGDYFEVTVWVSQTISNHKLWLAVERLHIKIAFIRRVLKGFRLKSNQSAAFWMLGTSLKTWSGTVVKRNGLQDRLLQNGLTRKLDHLHGHYYTKTRMKSPMYSPNYSSLFMPTVHNRSNLVIQV
jgi:hypothetical protein